MVTGRKEKRFLRISVFLVNMALVLQGQSKEEEEDTAEGEKKYFSSKESVLLFSRSFNF